MKIFFASQDQASAQKDFKMFFKGKVFFLCAIVARGGFVWPKRRVGAFSGHL